MSIRKYSAYIIGIILLLLVYNNLTAKQDIQPEDNQDEKNKISITQDDLDKLKADLEGLEFDDLSELEEPTETGSSMIGSISQEDLDNLGEALEELEFDDLGGLTE